jgi:hypothetical protein
MNLKIYIPTHKNFSLVIQNDIFQPIHVGKALSNLDLWMLGDDTWENISLKNKNYAELTAMYRARKNIKNLDYIGFFHYRRFLDLVQLTGRFNILGNFLISSPKTMLFDDVNIIRDWLSKYDIILPYPLSLNGSLYGHYAKRHIHSDLDLAIKCISELYPEYNESVWILYKKNFMFLSRSRYYYNNIFIMKYNFFSEYMEWIFNIFERMEKQIDLNSPVYKWYQERVFWFLAERLFNIFLYNLIKRKPELKIKNLSYLFIM